MRTTPIWRHDSHMPFYRRRLPHFYEPGYPVFLTWMLHGSFPTNRHFPPASGEQFAAMDNLLDHARTGPHYLGQPALAQMVVNAIHENAAVLCQYELHAFVVMLNHVHLLITPNIPLPQITKSVRGITAKRGNKTLGLTGQRFSVVERGRGDRGGDRGLGVRPTVSLKS